MQEQDLWWRLEWHRVQAMQGMGGKIEDRGNVVIVLNADLPTKGFNFACKVDAGEKSKEEVVDYVVNTFRAKGLLPHFQLWSITRPSDFSVDLWQRGFVEEGELDVMIWKKPTNVRPRDDVHVRSVRGRADIETSVDLVVRGFNFPAEWKDVLLSSMEGEQAGISGRTFLADVGGQTVGVAALVSTSERISGVYSVAVLPEYRRRGVATALSQACIDAYQDTEDEVLTLQAARGSPAQKLYEKLGFETAYTLTLYTLH